MRDSRAARDAARSSPIGATGRPQRPALRAFLLGTVSRGTGAADDTRPPYFRPKKYQHFASAVRGFFKCLFLCFFDVDIKCAVGDALRCSMELARPLRNPTPPGSHAIPPWEGLIYPCVNHNHVLRTSFIQITPLRPINLRALHWICSPPGFRGTVSLFSLWAASHFQFVL